MSLVHCLTFFILKALCSLVVLNLYLGSKLGSHMSMVQIEDSLTMMMHVDRHKVAAMHKNGTIRQGASDTGQQKQNELDHLNAAIHKAIDKALNQSSSSGRKTTAGGTEAGGTKQGKEIKKIAGMITPNEVDGTMQGKERLWNILTTRNVTEVDADYWASIPSWDTILKNIHHDKREGGPVIHGLETCGAFQNKTASAPSQRRLAPAGIFNTGTNYLSVLLEYNCQNPHRVAKFHGNAKRGHGNEWQPHWGKHSPASSRGVFYQKKDVKYTVDEILPIVLIRNPYGWMKSMCRNSYTATWKGVHDKKTCPQLKTKSKDSGDEEWNNVEVKYGSGTTHHQSLGHLWNDWYAEYFYNINATATASKNNDIKEKKKPEAPFPRLIIRFEDIIFFPYEVTKQICACAGGVLGHRPDDHDVDNNTFHYVVRSAKAGIGHGPATQRNGLIDSWARYGTGDPKDEYSKVERELVESILDPLLLKTFGYS